MFNRVCPRCLNQHNTYAKSSKAICEKCKELKKIQTRIKLEKYYKTIRKKST